MGAIAQCHERKKRPLIIDRWISPLLCPKPALHLWTSIKPSACHSLPGSRKLT
jgi:hypothetical protein